MKKLSLIFIVLLLCAGFAGAASAWSTNTDAKVTPSGSLVPGQTVSVTMDVIMSENGIGSGDYLYFRTPLDSAQWAVDIKYRNSDAPLSSREGSGKTMRISGFELGYSDEILISVVMSGTVPSSLAGQEISVISVEQDAARGTSEYTSKKQSVYNPSDIPQQISNMENSVNILDSRITEASKHGVDVSSAVSRLESAKSYLNTAKNAGSSDVATASANLANAETALIEAERLMVNSCLITAKSNIEQIDSILSQLAAKGWSDNRVILLTTTKQGAKNLHDTARTAYDATSGSISDTAKTQAQESLSESSSALNDAKGLLEESNKSVFDNMGSILPFIIIGAVAIIIIAGVIIFIRNRNDDWDELG